MKKNEEKKIKKEEEEKGGNVIRKCFKAWSACHLKEQKLRK